MNQISDSGQVKVRPISSHHGQNGMTVHDCYVEGVDITTVEGYWVAINAILERQSYDHP
jgi:hypothetical protein